MVWTTESLPIITYPYEWEPPLFYLGMKVFSKGKVRIVIGMKYQPEDEKSLDKGWWYWCNDGKKEVAIHERKLELYIKVGVLSKRRNGVKE